MSGSAGRTSWSPGQCMKNIFPSSRKRGWHPGQTHRCAPGMNCPAICRMQTSSRPMKSGRNCSWSSVQSRYQSSQTRHCLNSLPMRLKTLHGRNMTAGLTKNYPEAGHMDLRLMRARGSIIVSCLGNNFQIPRKKKTGMRCDTCQGFLPKSVWK